MTSASCWKAAERHWARKHGVERTGPRGFGLPDAHPDCGLAVEVKTQAKRILKSTDMKQAKENAEALGLPWVLVLHTKGQQYKDDLVVMPATTYDLIIQPYLESKETT